MRHSGGAALAVMAVVGIATAAVTFAARPASEAIAVVNQTTITREDFDRYAAVFLEPDGRSSVTADLVLESLVNQIIVRREAEARGIAIPDESVDAMIAGWEELDLPRKNLERAGGISALRDRFRDFMLFKKVKASVTHAHVSEVEVRATYEADPLLSVDPFDDVQASIRARLERDDVARQWIAWLASARACADIEILDPTLHLASAEPCER